MRALAFCVLLACPSVYGGVVIDFTSASNPLTNVNDFSPGTSSTIQLGDIGNTTTQVSVMSDLAMVAQGATTLNPASGTSLLSSSGFLMITFPNVLGVRDFSQNLDFDGNGGSSAENNGMLRSIDVGVDMPKFAPDQDQCYICIETWYPIKFCPWCGCKLARFYRKTYRQLYDADASARHNWNPPAEP